jgi:hypothetical protein
MLRGAALRIAHRDVTRALLGQLARAGDAESRSLLLEWAQGGDIEALSALQDVRVLDEEGATKVADILAEAVRDTMKAAERNEWGFGGGDNLRYLTLLNLWFPTVANWDLVLEAFRHPMVAAEDKIGTCGLLSQMADRLPETVTADLAAGLESIAATAARDLPFTEGNIAGPTARLSLSLGLLDDQSAEGQLARLAMGVWEERRDLARAIAGGAPSVMLGALATLASDEHLEVRRAAGWAAARRLATGRGGNIEREIVRLLAQSDGVHVVLGVLAGLRGGAAPLGVDLGALIARLTNHGSAIVREIARGLLPVDVEGAGRNVPVEDEEPVQPKKPSA